MPVGVSCAVIPSLWGLMEGGNGGGIDPVRLESVMQVVTSAGISVFAGQDVLVVMNFLLIKMQECLTNSILMGCPVLVRVSLDSSS